MLHKLGMVPLGGNDTGTVNRARNTLLKRGYLAKNAEGFLRITPRGSARLRAIEIEEELRGVKRRWDGRWRVLIFDIPERRKIMRDKIRRTLHNLGFVRLQDSVWIFPYDCEEYVALLKADFKIGKDVLYMIVDELESDGGLRERFSLPKRA
jgi:DNA-binding transcriptional regulator PaaX